MSQPQQKEPQGWLEKKSTHQLIYMVLLITCILLGVGDTIYKFFFADHAHDAGHEPLFYENWFFFYGIFGFVAYSFIVITAKSLRKVLMRKEDYYD